MAKAEAICICKKCGEEFEVSAIKRNRREADSWEEWAVKNITTCPECEKKAHAEYLEKVAEEAKADGLPELVGTEKQVNWALDIRKNSIKEINEILDVERKKLDADFIAREKERYIDRCAKMGVEPKQKSLETYDLQAATENYKALEMTADYIFRQEKAHWWIENKDYNGRYLLQNCYAEAVTAAESEPEPEPEDENKNIVAPEKATEGMVEIKIKLDETAVFAYYTKDEKFRSIVKDAGYFWDDGCWRKNITMYTGSAIERAADLANRLLREGFSVKCAWSEVRDRAVKGDFEPESKKWIKKCSYTGYEGWIQIDVPKRWEEPSGATYEAARKIKGSKWVSGSVVVPIAQCNQVDDFAEINGYKIEPEALTLIDQYYRQRTVVNAVEPKQEERKDILKEILESSDEVLADLEDD